VKHKFIKRQINSQEGKNHLKSYPDSISNIGLFIAESKLPGTNFITKLQSCFGVDSRFFKFAVSNKIQASDVIFLNKSSFSFWGKFKDKEAYRILSDLDMLIDISFKNSMIKTYAFNLSHKSFKIAMGKASGDFFHLRINVDENKVDVFADEIIKYHKILSHVKR
jgi:hypothetical protein